MAVEGDAPHCASGPAVDDLEDLFENAPCGYASALPDGRFSRVNRTLAAWLGYQAADLVGRRFLDLLTIAGKVYYETHFAPLLRLQGSFKEVAFDLVRRDGTALPVIANAVLRRDDAGAIRFIRITVFDASDRRRYERDLLEARRNADQARIALQDLNQTLEVRVAERARALDRAWRLSPDLLVMADADGVVAAVNAAWTTLLGWGAVDLVGQKVFAFIHPDDLAAAHAALAGIVTAPVSVPFESRLRHADGSYRRFAWTGAFEDGQIYGTGRHTTAQHEQADALRRAEEALRQSQKLEAVGQLTGGVAHDFNNLLTVIVGGLDMVLRRPEQVDRVKRLAEAAMGAARRGEQLTQQLLAFSRRQMLRPQTLNPNRLLLDFRPLAERAAGGAVELAFDLDPALDPIRIDPAQFEAAVLNLIVNARDAMEGRPGHTRIAVTSRNVHLGTGAVTEKGVAPGPYVLVSVTDTGAGIPPDKLQRVFEPFFTTKEVGKGTGLGLSQVYGFTRSANGFVDIASEVGAGTTVNLYFPRSTDPADEETGAGALRTIPLRRAGEGETVLLVEDDEQVLGMAVESLEELRYRVIIARNAAEALGHLRGVERIDILFSDVVMPGGMNGSQLAVEAQRVRPGIKVLLTSGYVANLDEGQVIGHGELPVLNKPYRRDELARSLRLVLGGEGR